MLDTSKVRVEMVPASQREPRFRQERQNLTLPASVKPPNAFHQVLK